MNLREQKHALFQNTNLKGIQNSQDSGNIKHYHAFKQFICSWVWLEIFNRIEKLFSCLLFVYIFILPNVQCLIKLEFRNDITLLHVPHWAFNEITFQNIQSPKSSDIIMISSIYIIHMVTDGVAKPCAISIYEAYIVCTLFLYFSERYNLPKAYKMQKVVQSSQISVPKKLSFMLYFWTECAVKIFESSASKYCHHPTDGNHVNHKFL